jgi:transcriptional regulator with XRE-family HTH domain
VSDLAHAKVMQMRAELIEHVRLIVQSEGWTQAKVAERFGVAQSRVRLKSSASICSLHWPHVSGAKLSWLLIDKMTYAHDAKRIRFHEAA